MLESYFENVGSLHTTYMKYVMSTPGKINKTLNIILYPFTRILTIGRILFGRPSISNMLVCSKMYYFARFYPDFLQRVVLSNSHVLLCI